MTDHSWGFTSAKRNRQTETERKKDWKREKRRERISRCKSSLQMSKYIVNHSEDLRVLKCFLTESVSQPSGTRMTKTLTEVFMVAAVARPSPTCNCTIPGLCKHKAKPKWPPFRCCPNACFVWNQGNIQPGRQACTQTIYLAVCPHSHESWPWHFSRGVCVSSYRCSF